MNKTVVFIIASFIFIFGIGYVVGHSDQTQSTQHARESQQAIQAHQPQTIQKPLEAVETSTALEQILAQQTVF